MIEVGRICIKLAGRDARKRCVIVDVIDNTYVLIDGETRRRKCNIAHLEPLDKKIDIKKGAEKGHFAELWKKEFETELKITKPKKATERPKKQKVKKEKPVKGKKKPAKKKEEKKAEKPKQEKEVKPEPKKEAPAPKAEPKKE